MVTAIKRRWKERHRDPLLEAGLEVRLRGMARSPWLWTLSTGTPSWMTIHVVRWGWWMRPTWRGRHWDIDFTLYGGTVAGDKRETRYTGLTKAEVIAHLITWKLTGEVPT